MFSIRKKLLLAFGVMATPLLVLIAFSIYTQWTLYGLTKRSAVLAGEVNSVHMLHGVFQEALMPANDYIITGNRTYADGFAALSRRVDGIFEEIEADGPEWALYRPDGVEYEKRVLAGAKTAWGNVKELSMRIFSIERPVGDPVAAAVMEEMDYSYGAPAVQMLDRLAAHVGEEHRKAAATAEAAWRRSWLILGATMAGLIAASVYISYYFSTAFSKSIRKIRDAAGAIGGGDFKTRVEVATGDEIEDLGSAINTMSSRLDDLYTRMDQMVGERTFKLAIANDEMKEREERLRQLIEQMPYPVQISGADGTAIVLNRAFLSMAGIKSSNGMAGRYNVFKDALFMGVRERAEAVRTAYAGETVDVGEVMLPEGAWEEYGASVGGGAFYDVMVFPVRRTDGELLWVVTIWKDISEAKHARDELQDRVAELERFMRATMQRETRMKELRTKVEDLEKEISELNGGGGGRK